MIKIPFEIFILVLLAIVRSGDCATLEFGAVRFSSAGVVGAVFLDFAGHTQSALSIVFGWAPKIDPDFKISCIFKTLIS